VPKKQRAIDAIKANPRRSNVDIAGELGVSDMTVKRARDELGSTYVEPEREGRDGKVYRLPVRSDDEPPLPSSKFGVGFGCLHLKAGPPGAANT
jgi:hypothetical protein